MCGSAESEPRGFVPLFGSALVSWFVDGEVWVLGFQRRVSCFGIGDACHCFGATKNRFMEPTWLPGLLRLMLLNPPRAPEDHNSLFSSSALSFGLALFLPFPFCLILSPHSVLLIYSHTYTFSPF